MRWSALIKGTALALISWVVAVGCTREGPDAKHGDLVWAIGETEAQSGGPAELIASMWNDQHPEGPRVRLHALPASSDHQRQLLATELHGGLNGLDVLTLDSVWTGEFAANGWLSDLEDVAPSIRRGSLPAPLLSATWRGRLWAAPFTTSAGLLYYRSDLVATAPTTWDELVRVGLAAARSADIAPFVGQGAQYEGVVVNFLELLRGAGGDLFGPTGRDVDFQEAPAMRALDFMRDAKQRGFYADHFEVMREEEALAAFQTGKAVFMRNWPYAYKRLAETPSIVGRFGVAALPTFTGDGMGSEIRGQNLGVSRFSQRRRAAENFVTFASTAEVQRLVATRYGSGPTLASVYDELGHDPMMALLGRIHRNGEPRSIAPGWSMITDEIQQNVFFGYTGRLDTPTAVRNIRSVLELIAR